MSFLSLNYFLVAAEEMNITKAAQRLYITQQSLSSHIQRLEEHYGVRLFERKPALKLTVAGEYMVTFANRILFLEKQMVSQFSELSEKNIGRLTVGFSRSRSRIFMPDIWSLYHAQYPNIDVVLVDALTVQFDEMLQDGKIDLYIGVDAPEESNTCCTHLVQERLYCIMSEELLKKCLPGTWKQFLVNARSGLDLNCIRNFPFIMLPPNNRFRARVDRYFSSIGVIPHIVFETSQHEMIYALCRQSYGVGLISQMYLYQPLKQPEEKGAFYVFPIKNNIGSSTIDLVYRFSNPMPKYIRAFLDSVEAVFQTYTDSVDSMIEKATGICAAEG
ncbi:LysR family transcriptional regulator [Ruminococcaceae bacterium BL-6]|jgi:DNA-binding transcriptional LysR family regulator|nr:LysR family transcriptional regulator [Ruminococcaceae bacterium BL-6]